MWRTDGRRIPITMDGMCQNGPGSLLEMQNPGPHPRPAAPVSAFQ